MDGPRPSSRTAPSIWYDAVAAPQTKPSGKVTPAKAGCADVDVTVAVMRSPLSDVPSQLNRLIIGAETAPRCAGKANLNGSAGQQGANQAWITRDDEAVQPLPAHQSEQQVAGGA